MSDVCVFLEFDGVVCFPVRVLHRDKELRSFTWASYWPSQRCNCQTVILLEPLSSCVDMWFKVDDSYRILFKGIPPLFFPQLLWSIFSEDWPLESTGNGIPFTTCWGPWRVLHERSAPLYLLQGFSLLSSAFFNKRRTVAITFPKRQITLCNEIFTFCFQSAIFAG